MQALATCTPMLLPLVRRALVDLVKGLKRLWSSGGKVHIAADGTKILAPRTKANQAAFAAEKTGGKKHYRTEADPAKAATVEVLATV